MKYNEKTGEKTPENRTDEVKLSLEQLRTLREKCNGALDPHFESTILFQDISISLGLLVDINAAIYNRMVGVENGGVKQ